MGNERFPTCPQITAYLLVPQWEAAMEQLAPFLRK